MAGNAPPFLTNHELDGFLGGGGAGQRQRQRLRHDGLLPEPADLGRIRQFNVALFPRFALAGLVRDLAAIPEAIEALRSITFDAFASPAFQGMTAAVRDVVGTLDAWSFDTLIQGVAAQSHDAVREWAATVEMAERELAERFDIVFTTDIGIVEDVLDETYIVSLGARGVERVPATRVAIRAGKGDAVAFERVRVLAKELGYLMPLETTPDQNDQKLADWFSEMITPPEATTSGVIDVNSLDEPPPFRRTAPRRARWHGASAMSRLPVSG